MEDTIIVSQLEVRAHVGVPAPERGAPQLLSISLNIIPERGLAGLGDDVLKTVDYAAVCDAVSQEVNRVSRHLIETVAEDVAAVVLRRFAVRAIEVEVRKFILRDTEYVAVRIRRERQNAESTSTRN